MALSNERSRGKGFRESAVASHCRFCGLALGREYYFTCHICGATYCYIHMWRHSRAHPTMASVSKSSR